MRRRAGQFGLSGIDNTMQSTLGQLKSEKMIRESLALVYWPEVVGENAANATEPEKVRNGTLIIRTKSSVWSQELTFLKPTLIEGINKRLGENLITNIVFKAKGLTRKTTEMEDPSFPDEDEMARIQLSPEEQRLVAASIEKLQSVENEEMRESLTNRVIRDRKIRHWRLDHGWKPCRTCTSLHREAGGMCPVCILTSER